MRPIATIALIVVLSFATGAAVARNPADRVPAAVPAGPPVNCIPLTAIDQSRVRDDRTIDFVMRGRHPSAYRVVLPYACQGLGLEQRFSYATSLSQLCSTDIITVLREPGVGRGASCGLAQFQPVSLPRGR